MMQEEEKPGSDALNSDTSHLSSGQGGAQLMEERLRDGEESMEEPQSCPQHEIDNTESGEDMEEDETEGLRKSLKKGYKAVKQFLTGSDEKRGDPVSTFPQGVDEPSEDPLPSNEDEDSDVYNFSHPKRGRAIIINNETFRPNSAFGSRPGSSKDAEDLKMIFRKLGFDVKCHTDLTGIEMKQALEREACHYDHQNADCLAVAILSHGDSELLEKAYSYHDHKVHRLHDKLRRDLIFGVDGSHISTASVLRTFQDERCPGLRGKPRLFFFQACRGEKYDDGVNVAVKPDAVDDFVDKAAAEEDDEEEETDARGLVLPHKKFVISPAPIFKDFLVMYATTPGHFAWRRSSGTWFIQSLHSVFTKQLTPHISLTQALTRVVRMVAHGYQSQSIKPHMMGKKQTPVIESMLTKDVYFSKK